jgi:hypothetical protein
MRRYKVIGPRPVFETPPGGEFERDLTPDVEEALLGVHLKIVTPTPPDPDAPAPRPEPREPATTRRARPAAKPRRTSTTKRKKE